MVGLSRAPAAGPIVVTIAAMTMAGATLGLSVTAVEAQSRYDSRYTASYQGEYTYQTRYQPQSRGQGYDSDWSVAAQRDRPGDYRCDAFWDANRTDCDARWRDQRHRTSYSVSYGHGLDDRRDHGYRDHDGRYSQRHDRGGYSYGGPQPHYGSSYRHPPAHGQGGATPYYGAYGRPDLVYPGSGSSYGAGRDARRIDWCRRTYRSYDPRTGYYRAYSGRLIYCG